MITQQTTQFKLCTKNFITAMYPAWGQFLLPDNLLANPVILKCKLWVGLVRSLQPWDILLIYCNNQLKKYIAPLLTLGGLSVPSLMSMSEAFSVHFLTWIKLCYTKALEWSSLVPGSEAKSSSEIMNLKAIKFTISYQMATHFTVIA